MSFIREWIKDFFTLRPFSRGKMPELIIRFVLILEIFDSPRIYGVHGPTFYRWLPHEDENKFHIELDDKDAELVMWFEQRGYVKDGYYIYDSEKKDIDTNLIYKQALLDAGPVFGKLQIKNIPDEVYSAIIENKLGDEHYINFAKRVIKLIYPPLSHIINLIRINYGQYWLHEFEPWDSRRESIGNYCNSRLQVYWSKDEDDSWHNFEPTKQEIMITSQISPEEDFQEYITKEDFSELTKFVQEGFEPSLSASFLTSAHRLFDEGKIRYSFIEAVISLELAIRDYIRSKISNSKELTKNFDSFWNLPIRAQVISMSLGMADLSNKDLELALKAIDYRNKTVHEGFIPQSKDTQDCFYALLRIISVFHDGPDYKFPSFNIGNKRDK